MVKRTKLITEAGLGIALVDLLILKGSLTRYDEETKRIKTSVLFVRRSDYIDRIDRLEANSLYVENQFINTFSNSVINNFLAIKSNSLKIIDNITSDSFSYEGSSLEQVKDIKAGTLSINLTGKGKTVLNNIYSGMFAVVNTDMDTGRTVDIRNSDIARLYINDPEHVTISSSSRIKQIYLGGDKSHPLSMAEYRTKYQPNRFEKYETIENDGLDIIAPKVLRYSDVVKLGKTKDR